MIILIVVVVVMIYIYIYNDEIDSSNTSNNRQYDVLRRSGARPIKQHNQTTEKTKQNMKQ